MSTVRAPATPVRSRIYEKIIWDTVRSRRYESFAELVADVKVRCAELRVSYLNHEIEDALAVMGDKVTRELAPLPSRTPLTRDEPAPLTKAEAAALVRRFNVTPKAVPAVSLMPARQVDRARAYALVLQGIREQAAVCRALERGDPEGTSGDSQ